MNQPAWREAFQKFDELLVFIGLTPGTPFLAS